MKKIILPLPAIPYQISLEYQKYDGDLLLVCSNEEDAYLRARQIGFFSNCTYFPAFDNLPYDRISPSSEIMAERAQILSELSIKHERKIIVTSARNLLQKVPPKEEFIHSAIKISLGLDPRASGVQSDKTARSNPRETITSALVKNGFKRRACATEAGDFSLRGEILDIVTADMKGFRLNFEFDKLEAIKPFDPITQVSSGTIKEMTIYPSSEFNMSAGNIVNFKANFLTSFGVNHMHNPLYMAVTEGRNFAAMEALLPLLYKETTGFLSYLQNPHIILEPLALQAMSEAEENILDFYESRIEGNKGVLAPFYPAIKPSLLYFTKEQIKDMLGNASTIEHGESDIKSIPSFYHLSLQKNIAISDLFEEFVKENKDRKIFICCQSQSGMERVKGLVSLGLDATVSEESQGRRVKSEGEIALVLAPLQGGFITKETIYLSQYDFLGEKFTGSTNTTKRKKLKNLLAELENLTEGELVVHSEHGIGQFVAIETIEISGKPHDCVKLLYADGDRFYLPVENLDALKRYGSEEAPLDRLGGLAWQKRKAVLKNRIGDLAQKLMAIAAARKINGIEQIFADDRYDKFAAKFPYSETEDQLNAIEDIKQDLYSGYPMDRLICGDVGFGKTEVAMRAAYLVASQGKQVAVISPTTILSRQHFASFIQRFQSSGLKIAQISRLVSPAEISRIKQLLKTGEIDIVVGTHALLAKDVGFRDLGLMIVDEEQHFGVAQKERLKELKKGVHILSLSATPIPRSLQMSLLGIRDLSLIATPPIDRLSVRTSVIPYDPIIIRDALLREHFRGGRSFYVSPRIKDLQDIAVKLSTLVPELTFQIAHGQMAPSIIDKIMGDFYDGKFDILLCTTIIESGIDVPAANTIIIHKAEMLGLSQLYQLRGRVGRSKARGYAYLTLSNNKTATKHAMRRLDIMQTVDSLGAGFSIASHDMDIRGFGNLVGDEQSGHVKEVGIELYQDMLDTAICDLRNTEPPSDESPTINLGLPIYLPEEYIGDGTMRLGLYRRISALESLEEVEDFRDELRDRFGPLPEEVQNLLSIIKIKQACKKLGIKTLDSGERGFVLKFREGIDPGESVMKFINMNPRHVKLRPDNKIVVMRELSSGNIVDMTQKVLAELGG